MLPLAEKPLTCNTLQSGERSLCTSPVQSFLSLCAVCSSQLLKERYWAGQRPLWAPALWGHTGGTADEWWCLSGGVGRARCAPETQGWAPTPPCKVAGTALLPYKEHRDLELLNNHLITFSLFAKAKASIRRQALQYRGYCCFVKFFMKIIETVLSIFERWCLWAVLQRWAEVKEGVNAWFLLIKMIDYYSVG